MEITTDDDTLAELSPNDCHALILALIRHDMLTVRLSDGSYLDLSNLTVERHGSEEQIVLVQTREPTRAAAELPQATATSEPGPADPDW